MSSIPVHTLLKRPVAPLPGFESKDGEDLSRFFLQFEETIARYNYPDYDKLLLLKQQVSGRAKTLLKSLDIDKQGYNQGKEILCKALVSLATQTYNVLKQLSSMNLDDCDDPFDYISKMRSITERFKTLNITVEFVLHYFFWTGLSDSFRSHIIQITNHHKPTLKEINDCIFEACERYRETIKT